MQRVASFGLVLSGMLLGMLLMQRPWIEQASAGETSKKWECVGFDTSLGSNNEAEVYLFNPNNSTFTATTVFKSSSGSTLETDSSSLSPNETDRHESTDSGIRRASVSAPDPILVHGDMNWDTSGSQDHHSHVSCFQV